MEKIKKIRVTIEYSVGLGDYDADEKTISELKEIYEEGIVLDSSGASDLQFPNACNWLRDNIRERDRFGWRCEIDQFLTQVSEGEK